MSITVRAHTLTLMLCLQLFWGPLPPENRTFRCLNLATKDLRDLLIESLCTVVLPELLLVYQIAVIY